MSTLTLEVPEDVAAAVFLLPREGRAALDEALRAVVVAMTTAGLPPSVNFSNLPTGDDITPAWDEGQGISAAITRSDDIRKAERIASQHLEK